MLQELKAPLVLINNQYPGRVRLPRQHRQPAGARQITNHLIELGHRRIAYIGDRFGLHSDTERCDGYRESLQHAESRTTPGARSPMATALSESGLKAMRQFSVS